MGDTAGTFAGAGRIPALSGGFAAFESRLPLGAAAVYVVALEYCGTELPPHGDAARRPVTEHAYDVASATLTHEDQSTRIGFPEPVRGRPSRPCGPRCPACTHAVNVAVTGVIERLFAGLADRAHRLPAPDPPVERRAAAPRRRATHTADDLGAPGDGTAGIAEDPVIPAAAAGVEHGGAGVLAGVGFIAAAGLITVFPCAIVLLILLLGACAPTSMRRPALRSLRHALRGHECAGPTARELPIQAHTGESPTELSGQSDRELGGAARGAAAQRLPETPLHGLSSLPGPADCGQLTELQLCWWWRASFVTLQVAGSPAQRTLVYESRRALLDALAARDLHSFACWLASGARAASDPARFFTATHGPPS